MVSIKGLDKAAVLAALYNGSAPVGLGFLQSRPGPMTVEEARAFIPAGDDRSRMFPELQKEHLYFDYLLGRPLKVDLSGDEFDPRLYDRDNGQGRAERIVAELHASMTGAA